MTTAAPNQRSPASALLDTQALMAIRNLDLRARTIVEGFCHGLHRSPYHGFSVEFTEYRQYTPGDDLRYVDWRVYARSDRHFIKRFEDETNVRCHMLVDQSRSMEFGSLPYTKAQYAATLAATLAYFLHLQGDAVGLLTFDEHVRDYLPARHRPGHLRQLMLTLDRPARGARTELIAAVERITSLVRKRGLMVLISDFLAPIESLRSKLVALAACGHEIDIFHVQDPAEESLELGRPARLQDMESGRTLYVDPGHERKEYIVRLGEHSQELLRVCRHVGAGYHRLSTAEAHATALFGYLEQRLRRASGSAHSRRQRAMQLR